MDSPDGECGPRLVITIIPVDRHCPTGNSEWNHVKVAGLSQDGPGEDIPSSPETAQGSCMLLAGPRGAKLHYEP